MEHKDVWTGRHKGIGFEVCRWQLCGKDKWNYYIYLDERQIPTDLLGQFMCEMRDSYFPSGRKVYEYYDDKELINDLDWHGGLTFYDKKGGVDGEAVVIEMGCDYSHLRDEGKCYDEDDVERDARRTIDKLWGLVPNLKAWCCVCGGFHPLSEGRFDKEGWFRGEPCPKGG